MSNPKAAYSQAGVDSASEEEALRGIGAWAEKTFALRRGLGEVKLPLGVFANVVALDEKTGLAISTDGVGTKVLVAQMAGRYDTVGIDLVAMNANDVLCVGAEPLAMVDYIGVEKIEVWAIEEIGKGLYAGCEQAKITLPGGEIAQVRDLVRGAGTGYTFDLVGTCVGVVPLDRIIVGQLAAPGDVVLGLESSGLHSNGYTLARRVLLERAGLRLEEQVDELGRTLAEELLEPTRIYVREVMEILRSGIEVKALIHVTGDGLLNLARVQAAVGFEITWLPEPKPIFKLIQRLGEVPEEEMYAVFNMGIGFCVVVPGDEGQVARVGEIAARHGTACHRIGRVVADEQGRVFIKPKNLIGIGDRFIKG